MNFDSLATTVATNTVIAANKAAAQRLADLNAYAKGGYHLVSTVIVRADADGAQVIIDTLALPAS